MKGHDNDMNHITKLVAELRAEKKIDFVTALKIHAAAYRDMIKIIEDVRELDTTPKMVTPPPVNPSRLYGE